MKNKLYPNLKLKHRKNKPYIVILNKQVVEVYKMKKGDQLTMHGSYRGKGIIEITGLPLISTRSIPDGIIDRFENWHNEKLVKRK